MYIFVLTGPPNAGKGTQAVKLASQFKADILSSSSLLKKSSEYLADIKNGKFISDDIVNQLMDREIRQHIDKSQSFILDGYPRTQVQAAFLDNIIANVYDQVQMLVINIHVPKADLIERAKYRIICDQDTESLKQLFNDQVYKITADFEQENHTFIFNNKNYSHPFGNDNEIPIDHPFFIQTEVDNHKVCYKRLDDIPETSNKRIDKYLIEYNIIESHYTQSERPIIKIDGGQNVEDTYNQMILEISKALKSYDANPEL